MAPYHLSPNVTCSFFLRLCSEVPILEDTLMRVLVIGLSRELPLGPADAMELADHLVKRAAAVQADGNTLAPCPSQKRSHTLTVVRGPATCRASVLPVMLWYKSYSHTTRSRPSLSSHFLPAAHGVGWARLGNPGIFGFQMWKF